MDKLKPRINNINMHLSRYLSDGKPTSLYDAVRHLPLAGGKRLRPTIAMLSAEAVGGDGKKTLPFGIAIEIIHNFTLVHDDIMDRSNLRRGIETVHMRFGENTAIIAGDVLFAKAFEIMHDLDVSPSLLNELIYITIKCVEEICEGQQLDMEFEKKRSISEEDYIEMIKKKTAVLFSCASRGGGMIGGGKENEIKALSRYGTYLGLAFQIWDDYLDLYGKEESLGKDIGNDIRNGKKTLIIVNAIENADENERKKLLSILGKKDASEEEVRDIVKILSEIGSIDYAKGKALYYSSLAKKELNFSKVKSARDLLERLAEYAISRER